jgi:hypothetical protein
MEKEKRGWLVRDKRRLLVRMMEQLAGNAHISFEGDLKALHLSRIPGASNEETEVLKRNTLSPKQVFVVLPLETSSTKTIIAAIGGTIPSAIIHVQIEKGGVFNSQPTTISIRSALFFILRWIERSLNYSSLRAL